MGIRIETVDIVEDLVSRLNMPLKITEVVDNLDGTYKLETCNTYYLQAGFDVFLGLVTYQVVSVDINELVTVKGLSAPLIGSYSLPTPYFFHGSILQTNTELSQVPDVFSKTPMVYLKRTFHETFYGKEAALDRESNLTLFFLTQADFEAWRTDDHDLHAIKPMRNMAYAFLEMLHKDNQVGTLESFDLIDRIKFGVVVSDKGTVSSYWNDKLSGVELSISLPINKNYTCKC